MHNKIPTGSYLKANKFQAKILYKYEHQLEKEVDKQLDIMYHSLALALYRFHSWNTNQIFDLVAKTSQEVWSECAADKTKSMVQMVDEELGIELMSEDKNQHWWEVKFLTSSIDDDVEKMDVNQWIAMRQSQIRWVGAQIMGTVLMSLYRKEKWGVDALGRLFNEIEDIKHQYSSIKELKKICYEETEFMISDMKKPVFETNIEKS